MHRFKSQALRVLLTAGCGLLSVGVLPAVEVQAGPPGSGDRQGDYATAARLYGVPEKILLGVSYLESQWDVNAGEPSTSGGFGPMHLTDPAAFQADSASDKAESQPVMDLRDGVSGAAKTGDSGQVSTTEGDDLAALGMTAEGLRTLSAASAATKLDAERLRTDPALNIRGGAALLAGYQRALGGPVGVSTDLGKWYGAVARYAQSPEAGAAASFADEVFDVIAAGATNVTDDGYQVRLAATRVDPDRTQLGRLGLQGTVGVSGGAECPGGVACTWIPAPYQLLGNGQDQENYGNHDVGNRPEQQKIEYIVIHDTEGYYRTVVNMAKNPNGISWHYTIRSSDGFIAQHVKTKDVAWQSGNWYVNSNSIGLEHEGFAAKGTWFTEAMYRKSARLVAYLAKRFGIPVNRGHIVGHDNVPGGTPERIRTMHWDPGPYWDWSRFFNRIGAAGPTVSAYGGTVTIWPNFRTNRPAYTGCTKSGRRCPSRGSSEVILRSAPRSNASLVRDVGLRPGGGASTMRVSDTGARASTGQRFGYAGQSGKWTAIWYLGQKAWFYNPRSAPTAFRHTGTRVVPKAGMSSVPVYGRAYPEASAYPAGVTPQEIVALPYRILPGQSYAVYDIVESEYYRAVSFNSSAPHDHEVIRGSLRYAEVQLGHRLAFVNLADVNVIWE